MALKNSTDEKFSEQIGSSKLTLIQFSASSVAHANKLSPWLKKFLTIWQIKLIVTIMTWKLNQMNLQNIWSKGCQPFFCLKIQNFWEQKLVPQVNLICWIL